MIRLIFGLLIALHLIFNNLLCNAQNRNFNNRDTIPERLLVDRINEIYSLKSKQLIFDLNDVPITIIENLNAISTPNGVEVRKLNVTRFIANEKEPWEATDYIKDKMLPIRKFLFAINDGTEWVFSYVFGGISQSIIVVYSDSAKNHTLNIFVTRNNVSIFNKLLFLNKIRKLISEKLIPIIEEGNICVYNGEFWMYAQPSCDF